MYNSEHHSKVKCQRNVQNTITEESDIADQRFKVGYLENK